MQADACTLTRYAKYMAEDCEPTLLMIGRESHVAEAGFAQAPAICHM